MPRFGRNAVIAVRDLSGLRHARALLGGYERWRAFHRLTGVFVAIAFVHGILDATPFSRAPALRWIYVTIGGIGVAFYLYREILARHFVSLHDYQVEHVELLDDGMIEISLKPLGAPMHFVPGRQLAMLYLEAAPGWRRHPFSIASPPSSDVLRFTVKALGDDTTAMRESVQPGMPAVIRRTLRSLQSRQGRRSSDMDRRGRWNRTVPQLVARARRSGWSRPNRLLLHLNGRRCALRL